MEFLMENHLLGLVIGIATFLIIGLFHPVVIKAEYYWGTGCWWIFLLLGIGGVIWSLCTDNVLIAALSGVFAFSSFWTIKELFDQRKRVQKGWFPANPKRNPPGRQILHRIRPHRDGPHGRRSPDFRIFRPEKNPRRSKRPPSRKIPENTCNRRETGTPPHPVKTAVKTARHNRPTRKKGRKTPRFRFKKDPATPHSGRMRPPEPKSPQISTFARP